MTAAATKTPRLTERQSAQVIAPFVEELDIAALGF
jgi:hypothetical protein